MLSINFQSDLIEPVRSTWQQQQSQNGCSCVDHFGLPTYLEFLKTATLPTIPTDIKLLHWGLKLAQSNRVRLSPEHRIIGVKWFPA